MATPSSVWGSGAGLEERAALPSERPPPAADAGFLTGAALPPSPPGHCSGETEEKKVKLLLLDHWVAPKSRMDKLNLLKGAISCDNKNNNNNNNRKKKKDKCYEMFPLYHKSLIYKYIY